MSGGAAGGRVEALPLPPKDAPEELKNFYRERQREYTRSKMPGISEEEKKKHLDRVAELKTQIDKARKEHPDWDDSYLIQDAWSQVYHPENKNTLFA